jgi:hypothetical protein
LGFEIVDHHHILESEIPDHDLGLDHPVAIGQVDFIALDRAGHGEDGRSRLQRGAIEHSGLNCLVDGRVVGGCQNRKFLRLGIGVGEDGEACIGAADIADQDRKCDGMVGFMRRGHALFPVGLGLLAARPEGGAMFGRPADYPSALSRVSAVARLSAIGIS